MKNCCDGNIGDISLFGRIELLEKHIEDFKEILEQKNR